MPITSVGRSLGSSENVNGPKQSNNVRMRRRQRSRSVDVEGRRDGVLINNGAAAAGVGNNKMCAVDANHAAVSSSDEEVVFLLTLRPSPTPRRRGNQWDCHVQPAAPPPPQNTSKCRPLSEYDNTSDGWQVAQYSNEPLYDAAGCHIYEEAVAYQQLNGDGWEEDDEYDSRSSSPPPPAPPAPPRPPLPYRGAARHLNHDTCWGGSMPSLQQPLPPPRPLPPVRTLPAASLDALMWSGRRTYDAYGSGYWIPSESSGLEVEDRLHRLEGDKDSLQLQVSVLTEQIDAQTDKIQEMEKILDDRKSLLLKTEDMLQRELLTRSTLETQKLELVNEISNMRLKQTSLERENQALKEHLKRSEVEMSSVISQVSEERRKLSEKPPMVPRGPFPTATSTPIGSPNNFESLVRVSQGSPLPGSTTSLSSNSLRKLSHGSMENVKHISSPRTPPPNAHRRVQGSPFGTLPRNREMSGTSTPDLDRAPVSKKGVAFGKSLSFLPFRAAGKRSSSAPNLAETEKMSDDQFSQLHDRSPTPLSASQMQPIHKPRGIRRLFGKFKGNSTDCLENEFLPEGEFRRGGIRATAAPRLGWTADYKQHKEPNLPFSMWDTNAVCVWMQDLGLGIYVNNAKLWIKSGEQLLQATAMDLEKELGIKHPLHRKKLLLAAQAKSRNKRGSLTSDPGAQLDTPWVTRWLDDIGLPQHKEAFLEARMDGRLLHMLQVDDLRSLGIASVLHVASLRRGIQILRQHDFNPDCLKRRSFPEENSRSHSVEEVVLWTNHRVMEWLRSVDLAEFAPNLRGSGVHGALLVYEERFTSDLLAALLSIPQSKTLLRRHLHTHFKSLLGPQIMQTKRDMENSPGFVPLTPLSKVKVGKKSQFSLRRKKSKTEMDYEDLVCPMENGADDTRLSNSNVHKENNTSASASPVNNFSNNVVQSK